jgi:aminoglycoside phosphotransferase (APT) family kinase protein
MTGPGLASVLADQLPKVLAPVLGPGLRVGRVEPLSGGASRQTWGIQVHGGDGQTHEFVLRTGRPGGSGPGRPAVIDNGGGLNAGLELEAAVQRAAAAAGMPVPTVLCASDDPSALGCQYLISARVPGETIPRRILRALRAGPSADEARDRLLTQTAAALAALHTADPDEIPGLPADDPPT